MRLSTEPYDENVSNSVDEILSTLQNFRFGGGIRCLDSLKETLEENQTLFNESKIPFKMIDLSTAFIEGEKTFLRNQNQNRPPTLDACRTWITDAMFGTIRGSENNQVTVESGYSQVTLQFCPVPVNWNRSFVENLV